MEKVCFAFRLIALTMALTACSGLNQEEIAKDVELLEDISEDVAEFMYTEPVDKNPTTKKRLMKKNPRMHDRVINLNYDVSQRPFLSLA